ncbi:hypothetical protein PMI08_04243 [Brevibacillus sp. CF112]|uniref:hypothetical protein n=1 Tax=Brevibacillus TaxID=55080 RepID=UPI00027155A8|nr:hypothetical protein [Brevibacillus sp. CF112]EJL40776.1 hypothetical protein PMI08_04243 [Brevibacillus sp. CF112]
MNRMNVPAIVKQIKASEKGRLIWQVKDGKHYVTNSHWALRTDRMDTKVLSQLVSIFGRVINEGESLNYSGKSISDNGPDISKIMEKQYDTPAQVTNFLLKTEKNDLRLVRINNGLAFLNEDYLGMAAKNPTGMVAQGLNSTSPFTLLDGDLLLLPVRIEDEQKAAYMAQLKGAEG